MKVASCARPREETLNRVRRARPALREEMRNPTELGCFLSGAGGEANSLMWSSTCQTRSHATSDPKVASPATSSPSCACSDVSSISMDFALAAFCAVRSASTMHASAQQPQSVNTCQNVTWHCTSSDAASWHTAFGQDELSLRNKRIRAEGSFTVLLTLPHVPGHVPSLPSTDATARVATSASHATIAACIQATPDVLAFERKRQQEVCFRDFNSA